MNLPGFAAEGSLYTSAGQYQSVATRAVLAGQVLPAGICCEECAKMICPPCSPEYRNIPGFCAAQANRCWAERQVCLSNCVDCRTQPTPCCPSGCRGTC